MLIRVLRPQLLGCDDVCSGSGYRPLKHGLFVVGFSLDGLLGLLVAVIAVVVVVVVEASAPKVYPRVTHAVVKFVPRLESS